MMIKIFEITGYVKLFEEVTFMKVKISILLSLNLKNKYNYYM